MNFIFENIWGHKQQRFKRQHTVVEALTRLMKYAGVKHKTPCPRILSKIKFIS